MTEIDGWVVYQNLPRFGIIEYGGKMIRVDLDMPHLEVVPEKGYAAQMIGLGKYAQYSHPRDGRFKAVVDQYLRTMEKVKDLDKITAVYKPLDPGTWLFKYEEEWLKIEPTSGMLMLFRKGDQMYNEIDRDLKSLSLIKLETSEANQVKDRLLSMLNRLDFSIT